MAKVSLFLDTRYKKVDKFSLKISVAHNGSTAYHPTGISLTKDVWQAPSADSDGFVKKMHPEYKIPCRVYAIPWQSTIVNDLADTATHHP